MSETSIACSCGHSLSAKGVHYPYCERMAKRCECDRLRARLARVVAYCEGVADSHGDGTPWAVLEVLRLARGEAEGK